MTTRWIGLSLGADICWPQCFEDIVRALDLEVTVGTERIRFEVERLSIEPFHLQQPVKYDVVLDRLTHWFELTREWIKKAVLLDGTYVLNNPWSVQSMQKHTSYCAMVALGMPIPDTALLPAKEYEDGLMDLEPTLRQYAKLFDLAEIAKPLQYPLFMKPYDGGGWVGVSKIDNQEELQAAYDDSGRMVMHLQKGLVPYDEFVRCVGLGPQTRIVRYQPDAPLHDRYQPSLETITGADAELIRDTTLTINSFFGWDFNSCELILKDGVWSPIDFANPCPDSQVSSLHIHFPWLVLANIRWALFVAAHKLPFRLNPDWTPFYKIAASSMPYRDKLRAYAEIAEERYRVQEFEAFCAENLGDLDRIAIEYFVSDRCKSAVRRKVEALYPEHEWDEFTEMFWSRIQQWREHELEQL